MELQTVRALIRTLLPADNPAIAATNRGALTGFGLNRLSGIHGQYRPQGLSQGHSKKGKAIQQKFTGME